MLDIRCKLMPFTVTTRITTCDIHLVKPQAHFSNSKLCVLASNLNGARREMIVRFPTVLIWRCPVHDPAHIIASELAEIGNRIPMLMRIDRVSRLSDSLQSHLKSPAYDFDSNLKMSFRLNPHNSRNVPNEWSCNRRSLHNATRIIQICIIEARKKLKLHRRWIEIEIVFLRRKRKRIISNPIRK